MADLPDMQMPAYRDRETGQMMVWDGSSQTYVVAETAGHNRPDASHATGGDNDLFDPAVHSEQTKNPLQEGILAHLTLAMLDPDDTTTFIIAADYDADLGSELRQEISMGHYTAERLREIASRHVDERGMVGGVLLDAIDWDNVGMHYEEEANLEDDQPVTMPNAPHPGMGVPQNDTPGQIEHMVMHAHGARPCPNCGGLVDEAGTCVACGYQQYEKQQELESPAQQRNLGPFPDKVPRPNPATTDNSFPTMASRKASLRSAVRNDMTDNFNTVLEEQEHLASQPDLDECPKCSHPMTNHTKEAQCHSCGHRQPVLTVESREQRVAKIAYLLPYIPKVN